jgi:hypothetical protein
VGAPALVTDVTVSHTPRQEAIKLLTGKFTPLDQFVSLPSALPSVVAVHSSIECPLCGSRRRLVL